MRSSVCVLISVDRLQLVPRIADTLEAIAPDVVVTTKPCASDRDAGSSAPRQALPAADEAGDSFVVHVKSGRRDVVEDVEGVLAQFVGRHPLSLRYRLFAEW